MASNLDKYKSDLDRLVKLGEAMQLDLSCRHTKDLGKIDKRLKEAAEEIKGSFERLYQRWYTEASALIRQLIPDRLAEFEQLYKGDGKRKAIDSSTFNIQDWLNGIRAGTHPVRRDKYYDDFVVVTMRFGTQLAIFRSLESRFESTLFDIRQLVQADLFDSELDAARELIKHGFLRGAGAIAGVVLEKHLAQVAAAHNIKTRKRHPTIADFNDLLKNGGVLDVPHWRHIQRLGDLRNLCGHNKPRDPAKDEVEELVNGVEKVSKTLF